MFLSYNISINFQQRMNMSGLKLLLTDSMGVYIPKIFCEENNTQDFGITLTDEDREILQDPYNEGYWDLWDTIERKAVRVDEQGNEWRLWLDGDLWLICYNLLNKEERECLDTGDDEDDEDELERLNNEE